MARIYQSKSLVSRLIDGAIAGALGGITVLVFMAIADVIFKGVWWATDGLFGSFFRGSAKGNLKELNSGALVGAVMLMVLFVLIGMGLTQYKKVFRRFKIDIILGGAIYGALVYVLVLFFTVNSYKPEIIADLNNIALLIATVLGGAVMGLWLRRAA